MLRSAVRLIAARPPRNPAYASPNAADIQAFERLIPSGVVTDSQILPKYNTDWLKQWQGNGGVVLRPGTTQEVAAVLKYCNERRLAVVPQGGNTGLTGGSVPVYDEIVLSLERLNSVIQFDAGAGTLVCGAGCVLEWLDQYLEKQGYLMPLDLGAKGSCQIGGNVSTNAGGLRLLRYGSLHQNVLGVKAVLPDGTVLDLLKALKKDNSGFDLKQLFIGSEGQLGVVTEVSLQVAVRPASVAVAFLACKDFDSVLKTFVLAKRHLAEVLSAYEFLDNTALRTVLSGTSHTCPVDSNFPFYVLLETHGSRSEHDAEKLAGFLEAAMESGVVTDGTLSKSGNETRELWKLREDIPVVITKYGYVYKYDVSMAQADMYRMVEVVRDRLAKEAPNRSDVVVTGYGHMGDGNLHLNVACPGGRDAAVERALEPFVYEWTGSRNGSVSAEHGIGQQKRDVLRFSKSDACIAVMRKLKDLFDPNHILNPYKVL